jgi:phosphoribosylanthranilate isomerase
MKLKICGMKYPDNIRDVAALEPDFMGFIFYAGSPRYVGEDLEAAFLRNLPRKIKKVGVFVDAPAMKLLDKVSQYDLDLVQLHGNESPDYCREICKNVEVVKAFGVSESFDFKVLDSYLSSCHYFLFDTKTEAHGGSGETFDWNILKNHKHRIPFFISGGIDLSHVDDVAALKAPLTHLAAIDVNSKFEISPGMKDIEALKKLKSKFNEGIK